MAYGLYKFEVAAEWQRQHNNLGLPTFDQAVSNVWRKKIYKDGTIKEADGYLAPSFTEERYDGPSDQISRNLNNIEVGSTQTFGYIDAPYTMVERCPDVERAEFSAIFGIKFTEFFTKNRRVEATMKIKIQYKFKLEEPEKPFSKSFEIIENLKIRRYR